MEEAGRDNIFIFGLTAEYTRDIWNIRPETISRHSRLDLHQGRPP